MARKARVASTVDPKTYDMFEVDTPTKSKQGYTTSELNTINADLRILAVETARYYWAQRDPRTTQGRN